MWKRTTESRQRAAEADAATVYARALSLLARREHAPQELRRKLLAAGLPATLIDAALLRLEEDGALSPARYAESLARARLRQGHGPRRIQAELRQQGVEAGDISAAMQALETDWEAQIALVRASRFGAALPQGHDERLRQARFLLQRGFLSEAVRRCLQGAFEGGELESLDTAQDGEEP